MAARAGFKVVALGDSAVLAEFATDLDLEVNAALQRLALVLRAQRLPWVRDIVPALGALALHFDPARLPAEIEPAAALERLLLDGMRSAARAARERAPELEIPVCYEGECAPDLEEAAARLKLAPAEIVRRHVASEHRVLMMGFAPGQPYIGGLDPKLALPRRATPRTRVPAGAVAIANMQTAVYPFEISGGWNVIGRTPLKVFDAERDPAALFAPGMRVRFLSITQAEFERLGQP